MIRRWEEAEDICIPADLEGQKNSRLRKEEAERVLFLRSPGDNVLANELLRHLFNCSGLKVSQLPLPHCLDDLNIFKSLFLPRVAEFIYIEGENRQFFPYVNFCESIVID